MRAHNAVIDWSVFRDGALISHSYTLLHTLRYTHTETRKKISVQFLAQAAYGIIVVIVGRYYRFVSKS